MRPELFKLLVILSVTTIIYLLYKIYQEDIHAWSCESEGNAPSCAVVGLMSEKRKNPMRALKFYKLSCEKKYPLGCYHLSHLYRKMQENDLSLKALEQSCELNLKMACQELKD